MRFGRFAQKREVAERRPPLSEGGSPPPGPPLGGSPELGAIASKRSHSASKESQSGRVVDEREAILVVEYGGREGS